LQHDEKQQQTTGYISVTLSSLCVIPSTKHLPLKRSLCVEDAGALK